MDLNSHLTCCLCNFNADTENNLEAHIDNAHSDIFRPAQAIEVDTSASIYVLTSSYQSPTEEDFVQVQSMFNDDPSSSIFNPSSVSTTDPQFYNEVGNIQVEEVQVAVNQPVKKERRKRFSMPEPAIAWAEVASEENVKRQSYQDLTTIPALVQPQPAKRGRKSKAFLQQQQELERQQILLSQNLVPQDDIKASFVSEVVVPFKKGRSGRFASSFPQPDLIQYGNLVETEPKIPEPDVLSNSSVQPVVKSGKRGRKSKAFLQQQQQAAEQVDQQSEIISEQNPDSISGEINLVAEASNNCKKRKSEDAFIDTQTQNFKEALDALKEELAVTVFQKTQLEAENLSIKSQSADVESQLRQEIELLQTGNQMTEVNLRREIDNLKCINANLALELEEFDQIKEELLQVKSKNEETLSNQRSLEQQLSELQSQHEKLQHSNTSEVSKLKQELKASKRSQKDAELKVNEISKKADFFENNFNSASHNVKCLELSLAAQQKKYDNDLKELELVKSNLYAQSNLLMKKSAEISMYKLSEERFDQETKSLRKEISDHEESTKIYISNSEHFEVIKKSLEELFNRDQKFAQIMSIDEKMESISDPEICDIVKSVLQDFVVSKEYHLSDVQQYLCTLNELKSVMEKDKNAIEKMTDTINEKDDEIANLTKKCENVECEKLSELMQIIDEKNVKILKLNEENKFIQTAKDIQAQMMAKDHEVSKLKEALKNHETILKVAQRTNLLLETKAKKMSDEVKMKTDKIGMLSEITKLRAELKKREMQHACKVQGFVVNLDAMRKQVTSVMLNKDGQIEGMIRQLKNRENAIGFMKKDIEAKMKKIATLEAALAKTKNTTPTIKIVQGNLK